MYNKYVVAEESTFEKDQKKKKKLTTFFPQMICLIML